MSDVPQGPGWWQASDGKYYPPEQFPGAAPTPPETPPAQPPTQPSGVPPAPGVAAGGPPPPGAMAGSPPPPGAPAGGPAPAKSGSSGCLKAVIVVAVIFAILGIGTFAVIAFVVDRGVNELEDFAGDVEEMQRISDETGIQTTSRNTTNPPQADISLEGCEVVDGGTSDTVDVTATGTIENHSSEASDYWVLVEFRDDGVSAATDFVTLDRVESDEVVDWTATSSNVVADGEVTCKIVQIERWAFDVTPPDVVTDGT